MKCLCLVVFLLLFVSCKRINDPIGLRGISLSGGLIDLTFKDFNFRIQEKITGSQQVFIYAINGQDSLIINIYSVVSLQKNSDIPLNAFRAMGIGSKFHSLPDYIGINNAGGEGAITVTHVDTTRLVSGEFSEDAKVYGLDSSDPNHIVAFPVKISGYFDAIRK